MRVSKIARKSNEISHDKGWWEEHRSPGEILCLIHSELSEALEEWRSGHGVGEFRIEESGKPEGFPIELADAVIRILDYCYELDIDIEDAIRVKMEWNKSRPWRHGNKLA